MVALAHLPVDPALKQAGAVEALMSNALALDSRAFTIIASREEAEYLVMLDHTNGIQDNEWTAYFVESMVEFLVWGTQPWGSLAETDLDWLMGIAADSVSPSMPALLFALVREMNDAPERLIALALRYPQRRMALAR